MSDDVLREVDVVDMGAAGAVARDAVDVGMVKVMRFPDGALVAVVPIVDLSDVHLMLDAMDTLGAAGASSVAMEPVVPRRPRQLERERGPRR